MTSAVSVVSEVEEAVASEDSERRLETLRRITALFINQAPQLTESHIEVFDAVILRLCQGLEYRARIELSERLGVLPQAPRGVVRSLAFDPDIAVAGPVLERSGRLDEDDLVAVAQEHGQGHLLALSRRSILSERITDVLVERGDGEVVRSVAGNEGARFSEQGLEQLLDRARGDGALQDLLKGRSDLPAPVLRRLVGIAREKVRGTLQREIGAATVVDAALDAAADGIAQEGRGRLLLDNFADAVAAVKTAARAGLLSEEAVSGWMREGRIEEVLAALAHLAGVPIEMVARAFHQASDDPLMFIVRAVRFGWPLFAQLLAAKAGRQLPVAMQEAAREAFELLSVQTAQRVVRFTAARERAVKA